MPQQSIKGHRLVFSLSFASRMLFLSCKEIFLGERGLIQNFRSEIGSGAIWGRLINSRIIWQEFKEKQEPREQEGANLQQTLQR